MKKISIFSIAILATALMGCDEIEESNSLPITNPQLPLVQVNNISAVAGTSIADGNVLDLQALSEAGTEGVLLYTIEDSGADLPEGSVVYGNFEMSATSDFGDPIVFDKVTDSEGEAWLTLGQLQEARVSMFGKSPDVRTIYFRVSLFADYEDATYQLYKESPYFLSGSFDETGIDMGFVIEDKYYLIGPSGWDTPADLIEFEHSDANVYDDPVFTLVVSVENDSYWKIVPQSAVDADPFNWDALLGPATDGDTSMSGTLVDSNAQAGLIEAAGKYKFTVNMQTMEYSITAQTMPDWIGTPNDSQGWDIDKSQHLVLSSENTYSGFAYFGGTWGMKLAYHVTGAADVWIGLNGELTYNENNGDPYYEGSLLLDEGGNLFEGTDPKLYWIDFNWETLKVYIREIKTTGIVGEFNGWDAAGSTGLAPESGTDSLVWSGTVTFGDASQWKFCFNGGWTVNLGAPGNTEPVTVNADETLDGLVLNGKNFSTPAGRYKVILDLTSVPYSLKLASE